MQARAWMVAAVLAAGVGLAACGSNSSDDKAAGGATTPATPPAVTTTPAATTPAADDSGGEVSSGGQNLAIGTRVVAPYVVYAKKVGDPQQNTRLGVTVLHVRKGKISDFKNFTLDAKQKATVPYYVDVRFENLGKLKLQRFLMDPSIEDSDGQEYKPLNLIILSGTFTKCPAPAKARLRPHEKFTLCSPILLPKGKTYERVRFQGDVTKDPYFWK